MGLPTPRSRTRELQQRYVYYRLREPGMYQDVVFNIRGELFPAHRCILSARSSYFAELFRTRWKGRKEVLLKHKLVCTNH